MKQFVRVRLVVFILLLIGCDSQETHPITQQATRIPSVSTALTIPSPTLTQATTPASPSIPSMTASLILSVTPTAVLTPTATLEPTREILITRDFDWNVYTFPEDDFAVSVPVDWIYASFDEAQLKEIYENADAATIALSILYKNDSYPGYVDARLQFLAMGGTNNQLATLIIKEKIPASYQQLPLEYALQTYVDLTLTNAQFLLEGNLDYVREAVILNDWPAIRVIYETVGIGVPYHLLEYYVAVEGQFYLLSFISWNERWEHDLTLFEQIAQSFQPTLTTTVSE